jgi:type IV pilus assembly protein PilW
MSLMSRKNLHKQLGYNLVELMIATFLGALISAGAIKMFSTSSANFSRLSDEVMQINNGQFVAGILEREVQLAGFMGQLTSFQNTAYPLDVCSKDLTVLTQAVNHPLYGFDSPATSPLSCLADNNFLPNTDILVVRRASTNFLQDGDKVVEGEVYIQANSAEYALQLGTSGVYVAPLLNASNSVSQVGLQADGNAATILRLANVDGADPVDITKRLAADIRKFRTDIYFISPCTISADETGVCTGLSDDGGEPIPALKRMSLMSVGGDLEFHIEVLAEGVENMQVQYGIDQSAPESIGSGVPNIYVNEPTNAQWPNVVNISVSVLIKNVTRGSFLNDNVYNLGDGVAVGPFNDFNSRKVYQSNFRLVNVSMRREVPTL